MLLPPSVSCAITAGSSKLLPYGKTGRKAGDREGRPYERRDVEDAVPYDGRTAILKTKNYKQKTEMLARACVCAREVL